MLNIGICKKCKDSFGEWGMHDDFRFIGSRRVRCPPAICRLGTFEPLDIDKDNPPENCPYKLEQLLAGEDGM